jgi:hypothetical protein
MWDTGTFGVRGRFFYLWVMAQRGGARGGGFIPEKKEAYVIEDGEGKIGFCTMWE